MIKSITYFKNFIAYVIATGFMTLCHVT